MEKLGAIALSSDIFEKANIGLWAFELDEGCEPRMYADDAMLKLIGLDHQISPEETYHAWYDHIDPAHYVEVAEAVEKMISGTHAEVQYPWHHPNGDIWIVRCGGVRNYAYTKGIRIEGTHQNVTALTHYEKKNLTDLLASLADNFLQIYFLDPYTGSFNSYAGNAFDESIVKYIRNKYNTLIGLPTAEELKRTIGGVIARPDVGSEEVKGRNLINGLPKTISISSEELIEAFVEPMNQILDTIHRVLEKTPPQLVGDLDKNGIIMSGGGSLIYGIDRLIERSTGIRTIVVDDAVSCAAYGAGKMLQHLDDIQEGMQNFYRRRQLKQ